MFDILFVVGVGHKLNADVRLVFFRDCVFSPATQKRITIFIFKKNKNSNRVIVWPEDVHQNFI